MRVIHGILNVSDLDVADTETLIDGLDILGNKTLVSRALDHLWSLLAKEPKEIILRHAPRLMDHPVILTELTAHLISLVPTWNEFVAVLVDLQVSPSTAPRLVKALIKFFPAGLVTCKMLMLLDPSSMSDALALIGPGMYYHPLEVCICIHHPPLARNTNMIRGCHSIFHSHNVCRSLMSWVPYLTSSNVAGGTKWF